MAKNYDGLAKTIIKDVGGKDNVISVSSLYNPVAF